jgi:hypothetical protein
VAPRERMPLAEAKEWDRAEQIARTIDDPHQQARALASLARELADASTTVSLTDTTGSKQSANIASNVLRLRACGVTALVLATDQWQQVLLVATRLSRQAALRAHEALTRVGLTE